MADVRATPGAEDSVYNCSFRRTTENRWFLPLRHCGVQHFFGRDSDIVDLELRPEQMPLGTEPGVLLIYFSSDALGSKSSAQGNPDLRSL